MAPHREGKRPQVPKSQLPRPLQAVDKESSNSKGKNLWNMIKPRLPLSAKKGVSQPGSSSCSKPRSSRSSTSGTPVHVTLNQPHLQDMSTSSNVGVASNSSPTTTTKIRPSPSQALTTAENVRELNISGGLFLNTPQATVVYGGIPSERRLVEEMPQECDHSRAVPDMEDVEISDTETQSARQSKGKGKADSQCTQMKDYDVYYRQLLLAGRGSPMWIPGPNMMLPKEYRRNGIGIGDVGIVYRSEGFSFLFNIFLPADHPVNEGRVPDDFEPLNFGQVKKDLEKTMVYGRGHHLASSSLRNVSGVDSSGLVFETGASEGAILIMPDGATTEDLLNHKLVKRHIAKNAQSWYTYIREERGREVNNGDIRLVIGFDKVASWGIATFASSIEHQVRLEFKTNDSGRAPSRTYTWNCVGGGSGRVGPHEEEMDDLREPNAASATDFVLKNQTVFVRTLNFNLKGEPQDGSTIHEIRSSDHSNVGPGPPPNQQPPSSSSGGQSSTGSRKSDSSQGNVNFQAAQFGLSVIQHPSNQINDLLLKQFPNAQMAITDDADWISVLTKEDITFPSPEDLCARLLFSRKIREKDGVVAFDDDRANSLISIAQFPNEQIVIMDDADRKSVLTVTKGVITLRSLWARLVSKTRQASQSALEKEENHKTRALINILWSCALTFLFCTWVAIQHIPWQSEGYIRSSWRRFKLMLWVFLVPELTLIWAYKQWAAARHIAEYFKDEGWTPMHGHFLISGGFVYVDREHESALDFNKFLKLLGLPFRDHSGKLQTAQPPRIAFPTTTAAEILEKARGVFSLKIIAVLQSLIALQCIVLAKQGLVLELVTLAFASLNGVIFFFWWIKPLSAKEPVKLYRDCPEPPKKFVREEWPQHDSDQREKRIEGLSKRSLVQRLVQLSSLDIHQFLKDQRGRPHDDIPGVGYLWLLYLPFFRFVWIPVKALATAAIAIIDAEDLHSRSYVPTFYTPIASPDSDALLVFVLMLALHYVFWHIAIILFPLLFAFDGIKARISDAPWFPYATNVMYAFLAVCMAAKLVLLTLAVGLCILCHQLD